MKDAIIKSARWLERAEEAKRMATGCTLPAVRLELRKATSTWPKAPLNGRTRHSLKAVQTAQPKLGDSLCAEFRPSL
jgi:hypothetical protein